MQKTLKDRKTKRFLARSKKANKRNRDGRRHLDSDVPRDNRKIQHIKACTKRSCAVAKIDLRETRELVGA